MAGVNKCLFIGNCGTIHDGGKSYIRFGLAVSEKKGEAPLWLNCVCFGKTAEIFNQYVQKGQSLYVEGRLSQSEYKGKKDFSLIVNNFQMLGQKAKDPDDQRTDVDEPF